MANFSKHGKESSGSIKDGEFPDQAMDSQLSEKGPAL
jgi:hypothetical protein